MTLDVLLVALVGLVASNIVLLVAAARSGMAKPGRTGRAPERTAARSPSAALVPVPAAPPVEAVPSVPAVPAAEPGPAVSADREVAIEPEAAGAPTMPEVAPPSVKPGVASVASSRHAARPAAAAERPAARRAGGGKRSRRFTLPSIEVDHERTERVVLSLLTGDDEAAQAAEAADTSGGPMVDAWERLVGSDGSGEPARAAVVVALALDGLDRVGDIAGRDDADRAIGTALDAIRRSARASDRVASVGRGHFRVLLVDADDAVAARFVNRVRETLERRPALAATSVALVAGWAEAHTAGHLEGAVHAAEDRRRSDGEPRSRRSGDGNPA